MCLCTLGFGVLCAAYDGSHEALRLCCRMSCLVSAADEAREERLRAPRLRMGAAITMKRSACDHTCGSLLFCGLISSGANTTVLASPALRAVRGGSESCAPPPPAAMAAVGVPRPVDWRCVGGVWLPPSNLEASRVTPSAF